MKRVLTVGLGLGCAAALALSPVHTLAQNVPAPVPLQAQSAPACLSAAAYMHLDFPLSRTGLSLASGKPLVIVAVGSSSTAGAGASSPAHSYPSRLEAELKARFPGASITVLNRGVNGEEAVQMLARFNDTVIAENPDLVLWQVGTNSVLRENEITAQEPLIREGVRRLKAAQADIVLIDPQYAPKVIARPHAEQMVDLLRAVAREERVSVFRRWDVMRRWHDIDGLPFELLLSPDGLHMNDWSYGCVAKLLGAAIADAARAPAAVARARAPRR